jgi:hypothetical protein
MMATVVWCYCCPSPKIPPSYFVFAVLPQVIGREILWASLIRSTSGVGVNKNIPPFTKYRYLSAPLTKKAPSQKYPVRLSLWNEMKIQTNDLKQASVAKECRAWVENERREESQVAGRSGREFDWGWGGVAEGEALRIGQVPVLCSFRAGQGRALRAGAAGALTVELLGALVQPLQRSAGFRL